MRLRFFILTIALLVFCTSYSQQYSLLSPEKKLRLQVEVSKTELKAVLYNSAQELITLNSMDLQLHGQAQSEWQVSKTKSNKISEDLTPIVREKASVYRNEYNELILSFKNKKSISFRLFDEGLAYRFSTDFKDSLTVQQENVQFGLS